MGHSDVAAFHDLLRRIAAASAASAAGGAPRPVRVLALCGAGLSAASGLATFRGSAGALWHSHDPMKLATAQAFAADPGLVWRFYAYRRHMALAARPNAGHYALAALARALPGGFLCLTQNVDGLSQRAGHPPASLRTLHGSLFDLRCVRADVRTGFDSRGGPPCDYIRHDDFTDPLCPALAAAAAGIDETAFGQPLPHIPARALPHCPQCNALLRPGVVWFGQTLDPAVMADISQWIAAGKIDLMLVIGTMADVYPAAGYITAARRAGAVTAIVNLDVASSGGGLSELLAGDFAFGGSAADLLPELLEPLIGKLDVPAQ